MASSLAGSDQKGFICGPSEIGGPWGIATTPCSGCTSSMALCPESGVFSLVCSDMAHRKEPASIWAHNPLQARSNSHLFSRTEKGYPLSKRSPLHKRKSSKRLKHMKRGFCSPLPDLLRNHGNPLKVYSVQFVALQPRKISHSKRHSMSQPKPFLLSLFPFRN